jgi:hypothetical protein
VVRLCDRDTLVSCAAISWQHAVVNVDDDHLRSLYYHDLTDVTVDHSVTKRTSFLYYIFQVPALIYALFTDV